MLKNAPIILLVEATASLDPENELYIQEAINELVKNKTVIIIAHRLNTVVHADQVVVLEDGRIVVHGNHDELMQQMVYTDTCGMNNNKYGIGNSINQ